MTKFGYHGRILHIDLASGTTNVEEPDERFYRLYAGGALLGTYYLLKHTKPGIDPLGPENLLIFANSVIAGYRAAGLVRYIVCAKSPLTNGVGEARTEGPWASSLKRSGYDALIFHEASSEPVGLMIDNGEVSFFDATPDGVKRWAARTIGWKKRSARALMSLQSAPRVRTSCASRVSSVVV